MNFKRRVYKRQAMELAALFGIRLRKTLQGHSTSMTYDLWNSKILRDWFKFGYVSRFRVTTKVCEMLLLLDVFETF